MLRDDSPSKRGPSGEVDMDSSRSEGVAASLTGAYDTNFYLTAIIFFVSLRVYISYSGEKNAQTAQLSPRKMPENA